MGSIEGWLRGRHFRFGRAVWKGTDYAFIVRVSSVRREQQTITQLSERINSKLGIIAGVALIFISGRIKFRRGQMKSRSAAGAFVYLHHLRLATLVLAFLFTFDELAAENQLITAAFLSDKNLHLNQNLNRFCFAATHSRKHRTTSNSTVD